MRLKIAKLAASPVPALVSKPRFRNDLLLDQTWPQDVNYLRDTYNDIADIWEVVKDPSQDEELYRRTEPRLQELVGGLEDVSKQVHQMPFVSRFMTNARHDFEIASMYAHSTDFASAVLYQSYSLVKIHYVLESLTREGSKTPRNRFSSFNDKKAYGYDISGEVFEGSGEIANRENQTNINDTAQPQDHHETGVNPANVTHDTDADKEFPELAERKHKRVSWPPRTR
jgi:hypothetical protein